MKTQYANTNFVKWFGVWPFYFAMRALGVFAGKMRYLQKSFCGCYLQPFFVLRLHREPTFLFYSEKKSSKRKRRPLPECSAWAKG
jgi:hypothetical protein